MINLKIKRNLYIFIMMVLVPSIMSAQSSSSSTGGIFDWVLENIVIVLGVIVLIGLAMVLLGTMDSVTSYQKKELLRKQGIVVDESLPSEPSIFEKMSSQMWSLIPMDKEQDIDLGHDYDGIRELDNKLPPWWVYLFYITIIWAVGYMYVYQWSDVGIRQDEEYAASMKIAEKQKRAFLARQANELDESSVVALTDESDLAAGAKIYKASCVACHGAEGQGGIGPNFTDKNWINGGSMVDIFKTIKYGVPEKGMISWQTQLNAKAMQQVGSFIFKMEGTNPPNPKKAEGDLYDRTAE